MHWIVECRESEILPLIYQIPCFICYKSTRKLTQPGQQRFKYSNTKCFYILNNFCICCWKTWLNSRMVSRKLLLLCLFFFQISTSECTPFVKKDEAGKFWKHEVWVPREWSDVLVDINCLFAIAIDFIHPYYEHSNSNTFVDAVNFFNMKWILFLNQIYNIDTNYFTHWTTK